jgi:hypothetical protein
VIAGVNAVLASTAVDATRSPFPPGPGSGIVELIAAASLFWVLAGLVLFAQGRDPDVAVRPAVGLLLACLLAFAGLTVADLVAHVPGSAFGVACGVVAIAVGWPWWLPQIWHRIQGAFAPFDQTRDAR